VERSFFIVAEGSWLRGSHLLKKA